MNIIQEIFGLPSISYFHQLVNQDSWLFLNVKEIHQDKKTIDVEYRRGMNALDFAIFHLY